MTPERWEQIKTMFDEALDKPAAERQSYISSLERDDPEGAAELRRLLAQSDSSAGFLDRTVSLPAELAERLRRGDPLKDGTILLNRFEILRFVARGGMGEVYEARDAVLQESVALKTIRPEIAADIPVIARFKAEVSRARTISSEHVCRVYEFLTHFERDGSAINFLTMELLIGETLSQRLQRVERIPATEVMPLVRDLSAGLAAAHQKHIVHGDLKSGNVMLIRREDGKLSGVITDFGLARRIPPDGMQSDDAASISAYGGTPHYMAPEQLAGKPASAASDVYSLGIVAFEMLTGRLPVDAERERSRSLFASHSWPEGPRAVRRVIRKCLEPEAHRRYADARALRKALEPGMSRRAAFAVAMGLVLAAAAIVIRIMLPGEGAPPTPEGSLAVLPFEELGASPDKQYFADGFTDELTNSLARISGLRITGSESSHRLRGSKLSSAEIGQKLGVRYLLSGSIRRADGRVRTVARLVNAAGGFEVWSREFNDAEGKLLEVQNRMAQQVSVAMQIKLSPVAPEISPGLSDQEARDLYWMGRFFWRQRTDASLMRSLDYYSQATARDPNYALAYAGMADSYSVLAENAVMLPAAEALSKARTAALKAIALDNRLADAYVSLAHVTALYDRNLEQSERYFRQALSIDQNEVLGHQWYAYLLVKERRFPEAMQHSLRALELDPLSLPANINLAVQDLYAGAYEATEKQCRKLDQMQPGLVFTRPLAALALARSGKFDEAFRNLEEARQRAGNHSIVLRVVGEVNALAGRNYEAAEAARNLIAERSAGGVPASYVAIVYAALGDRDQAFDWLERGYAEFDAFLPMLDVYPSFESIRGDPRYADLMLRLGFKGKKASGSVRPR